MRNKHFSSTEIERPMSEVLAETFERGDRTSLGNALGIPPQHVDEWVTGARKDPWTKAAQATKQLRTNNNDRANEPVQAMVRMLGGAIVWLNHQHGDDTDFAGLLREVSDVVNAKAAAEADRVTTPAERREIARQLSELIEQAIAYRDAQLEQATADERIPESFRRQS